MKKIYNVEAKITDKIEKKFIATSEEEAMEQMEKYLDISDIIDAEINEYCEISAVEDEEDSKKIGEEIIVILPTIKG